MKGQIGLMPVLIWNYRKFKCSRTVLVAGELQWMESALSAQQVGRRRIATMISFIFSQGATRVMGTGPSLQRPSRCSLPHKSYACHISLEFKCHTAGSGATMLSHILAEIQLGGGQMGSSGLCLASQWAALPCHAPPTHPPTLEWGHLQL